MKSLHPLMRIIAAVACAGLSLDLGVTAEEADPAPSKDGEIVWSESLSQAGVQAAFQILRQDYIRSDELTLEVLNRAALGGLLEHLQQGAKILRSSRQDQAKEEPGVLSEVIAEGIGWLRPLTFTAGEVAMWNESLERFKQQGCGTVILDLREPAANGSFEVAAAMLEAFIPSGQILFRLKQAGQRESELRISSREPLWTADVVLLVDRGTNNVGEAVAAVLRHQDKALLLGSYTAGITVLYQTLPLDGEHVLQYASAELLLEDGTSLFQKGIPPDVEVVMSAEAAEAARRRMREGRVRELVHETARQRFNEAALVARKNPELETYLKRSAGEEGAEEAPPLTDAVLQRAVDAVQARRLIESARIRWESAPQSAKKSRDVIEKPAMVPGKSQP